MVNLRYLVLSLPGLVLAISFHEFAHAWVADRLGDPTPRNTGRLTLEPWAHLDVVGTLMLVFYGFGWAKPVPVNPFNLNSPKRDMAAVAVAGPAMNLVVATVCWCGALVLGAVHGVSGLAEVLRISGNVNISFAAFNLMPVPPLDGFRLINIFLPPAAEDAVSRFEPYGPVVLLLLLLSGLGSAWVGALAARMRAIVALIASAIAGLFIWLIPGS